MSTRWTSMVLTRTGVEGAFATVAQSLRAGGWSVEGEGAEAGPASVLTVERQMLMLMA